MFSYVPYLFCEKHAYNKSVFDIAFYFEKVVFRKVDFTHTSMQMLR